jgi:hypothetical protein
MKENSLAGLCSIPNEVFQKFFEGWKKLWERCTKGTPLTLLFPLDFTSFEHHMPSLVVQSLPGFSCSEVHDMKDMQNVIIPLACGPCKF